MLWHPLFVDLLKKEFARQQSRNSRLSLRQWAKRMNYSSGAISEIFNGRRKVTTEKALALVSAAGLPAGEIKHLQAEMGLATAPLRVAPSREHVAVIRDWVNHAICGLFELDTVEVTTALIADRLGISEEEIIRKTDHLLELGLLKRDPQGRVYRVKERWDVSLTLATDEMKKIRQNSTRFTEMAVERLKDDDLFMRTFTFPGNRDQIEFVRREITRLLDTLDAMSSATPKTELIRFSAQIFPYRFDKDSSKSAQT